MTTSMKPIPNSATCIFLKLNQWLPCTFVCGESCPNCLGNMCFFTEATTGFHSLMLDAYGRDGWQTPAFLHIK